QTPLHLAVTANAKDTIDVLLRADAKKDILNFDGETPFKGEAKLESEELNVLFEQAADAVASGDIDKLRELLDEEPSLIHARSPRPHRATLLNYCGANGVEDQRQRTPANAAEIMQLLIDRGADVNAECNLYGGGNTTMGLLVTSIHPVR